MGITRVGVAFGLGIWFAVQSASAAVLLDRQTPFQAFLFNGQPFAAPAGDETWIDRETLAYYLRGVLESDRGEEVRPFLNQCDGVKLVKKPWGTQVQVHFTSPITHQLNTQDGANRWELYGFYLPKLWEFSVAIDKDGKASIWGLDQGESAELWVKVPFGPDEVLIRSIEGDLATGKVDIHLGAFWNSVSIEASARVLDKKFDRVDIWESVKTNLWDLLMPVAGISRRR